jgi:hypothetical protein
MTQVKINKTDFIADVNAELTRTELKAKYGVPVSVINDWAKALELTIKIKKAPKYVLVDEDTVENIAIEAPKLEPEMGEAIKTEFAQGF